MKTVNRCQKDGYLGRVFWSTAFTVIISVCILTQMFLTLVLKATVFIATAKKLIGDITKIYISLYFKN